MRLHDFRIETARQRGNQVGQIGIRCIFCSAGLERFVEGHNGFSVDREIQPPIARLNLFQQAAYDRP